MYSVVLSKATSFKQFAKGTVLCPSSEILGAVSFGWSVTYSLADANASSAPCSGLSEMRLRLTSGLSAPSAAGLVGGIASRSEQLSLMYVCSRLMAKAAGGMEKDETARGSKSWSRRCDTGRVEPQVQS